MESRNKTELEQQIEEGEACVGYKNNWHEPRLASPDGFCRQCEYECDI